MVESFWGRMQVELLDRKRWQTPVELAAAIQHYIEDFHNHKRRHSALNMLTPTEYGQTKQATKQVPLQSLVREGGILARS
jgi:transposase InsO family protein